MIIQEMDLHIQHRSGKSNKNADALSCNPSPALDIDKSQVRITFTNTIGQEEVSASLNQPVDDPHQPTVNEEIINLQFKDPDLQLRTFLLATGDLPQDKKLAKKLVLEQDQYDINDRILHHENPAYPGNWRIVVPKPLQLTVLEEAHLG